jgi:hypothetical protein
VKQVCPLGDAGTWIVIVPSQRVGRQTDGVRGTVEVRREPDLEAKSRGHGRTAELNNTSLAITPSSISYFLLNDIWHHDTDEVKSHLESPYLTRLCGDMIDKPARPCPRFISPSGEAVVKSLHVLGCCLWNLA